VYLKGYATMGELMIGLTEYFVFYNVKRPHQSLGQITPDIVYRSAIGGGAMILDKYPALRKKENQKQKYLENHQQLIQRQKKKQNRGSAVQLQVKSNAQLKLNALLS